MVSVRAIRGLLYLYLLVVLSHDFGELHKEMGVVVLRSQYGFSHHSGFRYALRSFLSVPRALFSLAMARLLALGEERRVFSLRVLWSRSSSETTNTQSSQPSLKEAGPPQHVSVDIESAGNSVCRERKSHLSRKKVPASACRAAVQALSED